MVKITCGHSVCSQHYIDTGDALCVHTPEAKTDIRSDELPPRDLSDILRIPGARLCDDSYIVIDRLGNFYASTYSSCDAQLISAAEDLRNVCKQVAASPGQYPGLVALARAALAKAGGL
jgi:hypothetical protein